MTNKGKLIEKVYESDLSQRATLVIFYLINRADQENTCFPSVKTIGKECNISTRTVQRALNDLVEAGFIVRESRFHEQGGQRSNLYHLMICDTKEELPNSEFKYDTSASKKRDQWEKGIALCDKKTTEEKTSNKKNYASKMTFEQVDFTSFQDTKLGRFCLSGTQCHDGIP